MTICRFTDAVNGQMFHARGLQLDQGNDAFGCAEVPIY